MDKWSQEAWLDASLPEVYQGSKDVTVPAAQALVAQSGIRGRHSGMSVLDNGAGMGQVTESLLSTFDGRDGIKVVCGDIDADLLHALSGKKERQGWGNVQVKEIDATVRSLAANPGRQG